MISESQDFVTERSKRISWMAARAVLFGLAVATLGKTVADESEMPRISANEIEQTASRILNASTAREVEKELRGKGGYERIAALHGLVLQSNAEELSKFFSDSEELTTREIQDELQQISIRKLSLLDPHKALSLIADFSQHRRKGFIELIYQEWTTLDIKKAVEHAKELSQSERGAALRGLVRARTDLAEKELREIGRDLDDEQLVVNTLASLQARFAVRRPNVVWEDTIARYGSNVMLMSESQVELLLSVAESWIEQGNEAEAIQMIFGSLSNDASRYRVIGQLMQSIVNEEPRRAFELAAVTGERSRRVGVRVMDGVVKSWAANDGPVAFAAASDIEDSVAKSRYQRIVVLEWANADPLSLLEAKTGFPPHLQEFAQVEALKSLAGSSPMEAIEYIAEVTDERAKIAIARAVAVSMAGSDLRAAVQWLQLNTKPTIQDHQLALRSVMLREAVRVGDLQAAIEVALEQSNATELGWVIDATADIYGSERALAAMQHVSDPEALKSAYIGIGNAFIREGKSSQAIELVKEQPMEYQKSYFGRLAGWWAEYEPHDLFDKLDELPSDEIKTTLATSLAAISAEQLTDEQKEVLRGLLSPVFQQMLD